MTTLTRNLAYWLWGAVLFVWASLSAFTLAVPADDGTLTCAAPGYTVPEPHVGQVRVIPEASAALVSPCAGPESLRIVGSQVLAEL